MSAVHALFLLSGFTGLVYEVLWSKYLVLSFGGTGLAQALVLAAFLGGLAAGNALLGPRADRAASPLRLYAWLELGIALLGFASPVVLGSRWGLAAAALSSALMGGTLPALSRWGVRDLGTMAPAVSKLYALNAFGAAAGSLGAAFLLIPRLGLDLACLCTAGLNLAVSLAAFRLSGAPAPIAAEASAPVSNGPGPERGVSFGAVGLAAFLTGLVALSVEVCWIRLLSIVLGSSVHSFAVMLAAFVGGIGIGGWVVASARLPRQPAGRLLALALLGAGASLLLTLPLYDGLPYLFQALANRIPRTPSMFPAYEAAKLLFCLALMLPVTVFLGMTLPLACRAAVASLSEVGAGVGRVCALNAAGNVLGALGAALFLLPAIGIERTITAGIAVELGAGGLLLLLDPALSRGRKAAWLGLLSAAFCVHALLLPRWDWVPLSFVTARLELPAGLSPDAFRSGFAGFRILSRKDDREATVVVLADPSGRRSLIINGKADASTSLKDLKTQILLSQLPLLLRPGAEDVLVVGLGSGITAGSALSHPLRRLDIVEICPAVAEAGAFFEEHNGRVLAQGRARLRLEDAKTFLARPGPGYDVIISEPSNPWIAGIGNLFSVEFYSAAKARLKPGGVMAQWFHLYEMDDDTFRLALRTFASVFPKVSVWHTVSRDVILLGSTEPLEPRAAALEAAFSRPTVRAELSRIGIGRPATLLSLQTAGDAVARGWAGRGPLNTDRFPRLEYTAPKALFLRASAPLPLSRTGSFDVPPGAGLAQTSYLADRGQGLLSEEFAEIAAYGKERGGAFRRRLAEAWVAAWPRDIRAPMNLAQACIEANDPEAALALLRPRIEKSENPAALELAAEAELALAGPRGDGPAAARAAALLERLLRLESRGADAARAHHRLAGLAKRRGDYGTALSHLKQAARKARPGSEPSPDYLWMEAAALALDHDDSTAMLDCLEKALEANPENTSAKDLLSVLLESRPPESR